MADEGIPRLLRIKLGATTAECGEKTYRLLPIRPFVMARGRLRE